MLTALRANLSRTMNALYKKSWFPQVPVSLAVALVALLHLIPVFDQLIELQLHLRTPGSVRMDLTGIKLIDISQLTISVFLLLMSVGLWLRSQISWVLAMLATVVWLANLYLQTEIQIELWPFAYNTVMMGVLLLTRKHFNRSNMKLGTFVALATVVVLIGYTLLGIYHLGDQFSPKITTLSDAVYVAVITLSTVGFGDFTPTTTKARMFLIIIIFLNISVLSTAIGTVLIPALANKIKQIRERRHNMKRNDHYIIVGHSALSSNTYRELVQHDKHVTIILRNEPSHSLLPDADPDIVVGDGSDLHTLREAGAENAKAIMALLDDDSENAFVILAAKELQVNAKTVAAVNDVKNLNRIRRVHPDMIIAPQVLGGELLTSMLVGERIDVKKIMDSLLGHSDGKKA